MLLKSRELSTSKIFKNFSKQLQVVLIIGMAGACRSNELANMMIDKDDILIIHVPDTKTYKWWTFTICNTEKENLIDVSICKKYFSLRPKNMNSRRLFVKYHAKKFCNQNVEHHTIGALPSKIASYLNLPNCKEYTGHSFRRTSPTLLADSGADVLALKRHGGWKSASVAEGYVEDSINNNISIAKKILGGKHQAKSTITRSEDLPATTTNYHTLDEPGTSIETETIKGSVSKAFPAVVANQNSSAITASNQLQLSNMCKQGTTFSNCTINNPIFNINITNNN